MYQALNLPKILNLNPRSAMNKIKEIQTFIEEEEIDLAVISESHDRENKRLEESIELSNHTVISNLYQRSTKEKGGRPSIIANKIKYNIENLTNTSIDIPWGVEVTWAIMTPKEISKDSIIRKIVVGAIYVKPKSKKKSATIDHIAEVYNMLKSKYPRGLYWVLAGDTNNLKLGPILRLNSKLKSVVKKPTRIDPKNPKKISILDNIITDLHAWYQEPECLPPINSDTDTGKPSDHLTVVFKPISAINNIPLRKTRKIITKPITESGLELFRLWIQEQSWNQVEETHDINIKTSVLLNILNKQVNSCFPEKTVKLTSDDSPWCNNNVKRLKRQKCREYSKHRRSEKWFYLNEQYKTAQNNAKSKYYRTMVKDLKTSNPSQWYSKLKRLGSYDQEKMIRSYVKQ